MRPRNPDLNSFGAPARRLSNRAAPVGRGALKNGDNQTRSVYIAAMYGFTLAAVSAALFAASVPASKVLLQFFAPLQLAGLLYVGAALAMLPVVSTERRRFGRVPVDRANYAPLAGVVFLGGMAAPVLLLAAFRMAPAGTVSLLLNFELVATALLGAALFREHLTRAAWLGVAGVVAAGSLLSSDAGWPGLLSMALVLAACTCWGMDNNLSAVIDGMTPARSTVWKGAVAGAANLALGCTLEPLRAPGAAVAAAIAVGAVSYGASVALHTAAAQRLGAVRAQGVFASAPFLGAVLSVAFLGEQLTSPQLLAAALFLISAAALVASRHEHPHGHAAAEHIHAHTHNDGHHQHEHVKVADTPHTHWHQHDPSKHAHPHWPDLHHRHTH